MLDQPNDDRLVTAILNATPLALTLWLIILSPWLRG
jgi:hypothetical protein